MQAIPQRRQAPIQRQPSQLLQRPVPKRKPGLTDKLLLHKKAIIIVLIIIVIVIIGYYYWSTRQTTSTPVNTTPPVVILPPSTNPNPTGSNNTDTTTPITPTPITPTPPVPTPEPVPVVAPTPSYEYPAGFTPPVSPNATPLSSIPQSTPDVWKIYKNGTVTSSNVLSIKSPSGGVTLISYNAPSKLWYINMDNKLLSDNDFPYINPTTNTVWWAQLIPNLSGNLDLFHINEYNSDAMGQPTGFSKVFKTFDVSGNLITVQFTGV